MRAGKRCGEQDTARSGRQGTHGIRGGILVRNHPDGEAPFGERACLVETCDIDSAERLHRTEPPHDSSALRQPPRDCGLSQVGK